MRTVQATVRRHPQAADAGLAALIALANVPAAAGAGTSAAGWVWFGVLHLPLVWRRRAPILVFWAVFALVGGGGVLFGPVLREQEGAYQLIVALVAVYTIARYRPRRSVWVPAAAVAVPVVADWLLGALQFRDLATIIAVLAATVLLGVTLSTRQAYRDEREARIRRLEHERDQQARLAVAAERARIARELHDVVAHNLTVMIALADGAAVTATAAPERAADAMRKASGTGREALAEMRRLVGLLRDDQHPSSPPARTPPPGLDDLDGLVEQVRAAGLRVEMTREGAPGAWGPGAGLAVYRIMQEALTNTLKHAGPHAAAQVRLSYTARGAKLEVTDDGAQRPLAPGGTDGGGHGLAGMTERAAAYGGHLDAGPRPGHGWRVHVHLRFDEAVDA